MNLLGEDECDLLGAVSPSSPSPLLIPTTGSLSRATGRHPSKAVTAVDVS